MGTADRLKDYFVSGLLLLAPLVLTVFVLKLMFDWSLFVIDPVVAATGLTRYTSNDRLAAQFLGLLLVFVAVTFSGFLTRTRSGRKFLNVFGNLVNLIPLVRGIYSTIKQVSTAFSDRESSFRSTVLVQYPREDTYKIGFVTGEAPDRIDGGEDLRSVFLPASPNPTTGELLLVPENQIKESGMSVGEGLRYLMTTGMTVKEEEMEDIAREGGMDTDGD
ncbi:MAG: DUF502 domain-containing protein [Candidatus Nanohaloarchaea archaeon]